MKFSSFNIDQELINVLNQLNYVDLTPIQEKTIPLALKNKSFIAKAETGSGKTHAFLVPTIQNLDKNLNYAQAIIIEPTLELCHQIFQFCESISKIYPKFKAINIATTILTKPLTFDSPTIVITTPNKLNDTLFKFKYLDTSKIKTIILDEADMLLEGEESQRTISLVDYFSSKQKLIFTATMKQHQISSLKKLFTISNFIEVNKNFTSNNVSHHFVNIKHKKITQALLTFIKVVNPYFTLVFASKKQDIKKIYLYLCEQGIKCGYLTSDESLRERKNTLKRIENGEFDLVLCSDLASRGIDFAKVSHVISLDIPNNIDYYYHRSGRTGRYKEHGDSYIFYDDDLNKKAKNNLETKLTFDYLTLTSDSLKIDRNYLKKPKKKNDVLEAEIKKELAKVRSKKVKPNYKKKMRKAVQKAYKAHKRKIIMENLKSKRKMMAYKD